MTKLKRIKFEDLHYLPFNRDFKLRKSLVSSMEKHGELTPIIICKTDIIDGISKYYVLDGQHRALAYNYLGLSPLCFIIDLKVESVIELVLIIAKLNNNSVAWALQNYVIAYLSIEKGNNYFLLNKLSHEYGMSISIMADMLSGSLYYGNATSYNSKKVKEGSFVITSLESTLETLELAKTLPLVGNSMIQAFHVVRLTMDNFSINKFKEKLEKNIEYLKAVHYSQYKDVFQDFLK